MENKKSILSIRIKELRNELNLTQEELAKKLGLNNKSSIANYESGYSVPSDEIKLKMCEIFNCSMDYLMGKSVFKNNADDYINLVKLHIAQKITQNHINELKTVGILGQKVNEFTDLLMDFAADGMPSDEMIKKLANKIVHFVDENFSKKFEELYHKCSYEFMHLFINFHLFFPGSKTKPEDTVTANYPILTKQQIKELQEIMEKVNYEYFKIPPKKSKTIYTVSNNNLFYIPVYGQISAGQPNWAEENIEGRLPIDTDLMDIYSPEEYFFLRVNGESMNKVIKNGAFALIHKQDTVENGEIAVVLVNGYDATLKKFTKQGDLIILEPNSTDESFETQVYDKTTSIKILGKYVGKLEINK